MKVGQGSYSKEVAVARLVVGLAYALLVPVLFFVQHAASFRKRVA